MNKKNITYYLLIFILFFNCCNSKQDNSEIKKSKRIYSKNKMYSVVLPEKWKKNIFSKKIFQLMNSDESVVMTSTLFYIEDLTFDDFIDIRFKSVDLEIWEEIDYNKYNFKSNYPMKTRIYSYNKESENDIYVVNCIKYKEFYYLSLTFIIDLDVINKEINNINTILMSLNFH